ncbi:MAG: isocitrate dehydrogenase (NADP(+)) [Bacteroidetes bacterium 4572_77]|nr:MAG: isocitrate dehydrogenase (NADP(+)) [Bacteroidetes bacterium 4572_77]
MPKNSKIIYTHADEAPALATYSLLPIVNAFTKRAQITVETKDISLAARILANFPEKLSDKQKKSDDLAFLGELVNKEEANIIKLPNISASIPQLKAAIQELQNKGYQVPNYPEEGNSAETQELKLRFAKVLGSAVNPVLRQGNSDRRVAPSVKAFAQKNPKKLGAWSSESKSHVAWMKEGDFYGNEKSITIAQETNVKIVLEDNSGNTQILKDKLPLLKGEVIDGTFLSAKALRSYIEEELQLAKEKDLLFSAHLKATMMKVSDPIIFGHFVSVFYKDVFEKHAETFQTIGVNADLGLGDLYKRIAKLPAAKQAEIETDIKAVYAKRPALAMVDSDKGITNLHASNDIIIDASMPVVIRDSGKMWNAQGKLQDTKAMIPDRSYAKWYQEAIKFCKQNGAFDPSKMGNVANVGLMAQKAEEYGSHDKTFKIPSDGIVRLIDDNGTVLMEHKVEQGDIWRGSQVKDIPIKDWVKLGVSRAKATGSPAIFWLDKNRAHDAQLITKVERYLKDHDTSGLTIKVMEPEKAMKYSLQRTKDGLNTISITGNVLRDYLTDLFPILELGTSAKMLSIVPLLAGGGLFETGAGGSAPKHVQQFEKENHLRWDSLGEYLALSVSIEDLGHKTSNKKALVLAKALDAAVSKVLDNDKSPSRKVNEIDNRGGHFNLALYWAEALSAQNEDSELQKYFEPLAQKMNAKKALIEKELIDAQGKAMDIGGYFLPNKELAEKAMRPSDTLNALIEAI